jgi:hypothetical protein
MLHALAFLTGEALTLIPIAYCLLPTVPTGRDSPGLGPTRVKGHRMGDTSIVREIMAEFGDRTGLTNERAKPRRYLWTDAFAVCNYLALFRETGDEGYLEQATKLIGQVHRVLGRHREDDTRTGWISGFDEYEGERHPTRGGLRIGKVLNERRADEPLDEDLEWERDGQYFHYLTKWMHALDCVARVTGNADYARWALELAQTVHAAFTYTQPLSNRNRMVWKMSIDLSYPLVSSMGQHDPLDGLITFEQLQATARRFGQIGPRLDLTVEIADMGAMCEAINWATDDALGIGGLLADAFRLAQLIVGAGFNEAERLSTMLADAGTGLDAFARQGRLDYPADYRLAFRELGLCIGLHAVTEMWELIERHSEPFASQRTLQSRLSSLGQFLPIAEKIEDFWLDSVNQRSQSWIDHLDINNVMLATSLAPDGYLVLQ